MAPFALIVDIVGSRELVDRPHAQEAVVAAFRASPESEFTSPLWPTVGDEFQAIFPTLGAALRATTLARLSLPPEVDCRFGLGSGDVVDVAPGQEHPIQDGSAWWNAREAIQEAHRREDRANPWLRSWFSSDDDTDALVNSYLLVRDHAISGMKARERRLVAGALGGASQSELARAEGVSQSSVSQSLRRSGGAALVAVARLWEVAP